MLKFEKKEQKKWELTNNETHVQTFKFLSSSITKKFFIVAKFIESMSEMIGDEFDAWMTGFLTTYTGDADPISPKYRGQMDWR